MAKVLALSLAAAFIAMIYILTSHVTESTDFLAGRRGFAQNT